MSFFPVSFFAGELLAAYTTRSKSNKTVFQSVHTETPQKHALSALWPHITAHPCFAHSPPIKRDTTSCMGQARQGLLWNTKPTQHAIVAIQVYTQYSDNNQGRYIAPNTARQWRDILDTIIESGLTKIALNYCPRQERVPKAHTFPLFLPPLAAAAVLPAALLPAARWQRQ